MKAHVGREMEVGGGSLFASSCNDYQRLSQGRRPVALSLLERCAFAFDPAAVQKQSGDFMGNREAG